MSVKINSLEFENVKRIKAVALTPAQNGLTVIGGKNIHLLKLIKENKATFRI